MVHMIAMSEEASESDLRSWGIVPGRREGILGVAVKLRSFINKDHS